MSIAATQSWLLGLAAPLEELNGHRHDVLGGGPRGRPSAYWFLREIGVEKQQDLIDRIEFLFSSAEIASRPAWELVRLAFRAGAGYVTHLFEAKQAWSFLERAGKIARARYESWEAYGADYVKGRQEFQRGRGRGGNDEVAAVARLLKSRTSPWRLAAWGADRRGARPVVCPSRRLIVGKGQQFSKINDALREASNGDVIEIRSGTYGEALRPRVNVELVAKGRVIVESKLEHALFVDGVGVGARGISWIGARKDRSAVAVRDGGVLRLERCTITSLSHGVTAYDESTIAFLRNVKIKDVGDLGISAWDHAWLRAEHVEVSSPTRSGISSEQSSHVVLERCRVRGAGESGLLVIDASSAIVRDSSFEKCAWNNLQVSGGSLEVNECTSKAGGTGLLARGGSVVINGLQIERAAGNGLELSEKTKVKASSLEITNARGSAVFVAGGELELVRSRLEAPAFDGVTVMKGSVRVAETEIVSPGRVAIWLEKGRGRAEVSRVTVRGG